MSWSQQTFRRHIVANRIRLRPLIVTSLLAIVSVSAAAALPQDPDALNQASQELRTVPAHEPTADELSKNENVATALMRTFGNQEYEFRAAAEAMPEDKYSFRPAVQGKFTEAAPFGPTDLRTFAEQVKHVACANFAFAAELDTKEPPAACDKGGPSPAKTRAELLTYLRNSFAALNKSLNAITVKNMYEPINGPYAGPNTRLGLAEVAIWHVADHYGQLAMYLRLSGIVPPASRPTPPDLRDYPAH
jgi:DinB superfamily